MMFYLVRLMLFGVVGGVFLVLFRKRIVAYTKRNIFISSVILVVFFILAMFPFEYSIISFDTPEGALKYSYVFPRNIEKIEHENCAFFIFRDISKEHIVHFDKIDGKWRIQSPSYSTKSKAFGTAFIIQQYDKASKCQLVVIWKMCKNDEILQIDDTLNSSFTRFSKKINNSGPYRYEVYYYTVLDSKLTDYSITVDGQTAKLT